MSRVRVILAVVSLFTGISAPAIGLDNSYSFADELAIAAKSSEVSLQRIMDIAGDPEGGIWFVAMTDVLGRVSDSGQVSIFRNIVKDPRRVIIGTRGQVWVAGSSALYEISRSGELQHEYRVSASSILIGPDGDTWFTEGSSGGSTGSYVGKVLTPDKVVRFSADAVTERALALGNPKDLAQLSQDGVWFVLDPADKCFADAYIAPSRCTNLGAYIDSSEATDSIAHLSGDLGLKVYPIFPKGFKVLSMARSTGDYMWVLGVNHFDPENSYTGPQLLRISTNGQILDSSRVSLLTGNWFMSSRLSSTADGSLWLLSAQLSVSGGKPVWKPVVSKLLGNGAPERVWSRDEFLPGAMAFDLSGGIWLGDLKSLQPAQVNLVRIDLDVRPTLFPVPLYKSIAVQEAEIKALAEAEARAKAQAEAEAKAAIPAAKSETPSVKTTIKCRKGSAIKRVTAVNPKCPAGYKRLAS